MPKHPALGKGLGALMGPGSTSSATKDSAHDSVLLIPVTSLVPNPEQPRKRFSNESLAELARSIKSHGIIQPLVVQPEQKGIFTIIAGERRFRAAQIAGLTEVPAVIKSSSTEKRLELALVENIQREDLDPLEEAEAYSDLMSIGNRSQEEVADLVGKSRSAVANTLRLLKLPHSMREAIHEGTLSPGHARAILSMPNVEQRQVLFARILGEGLSVREAERYAALGAQQSGQQKGKVKAHAPTVSKELHSAQEELIKHLGTKVQIKGTIKKGSIIVEYFSETDLERILEILRSDNSR